MGTTDTDGYSRLSVALHWLAAAAVIALFLTHEGERGSAMRDFHIGGGAILGVLLLWRVGRRLMLGWPPQPDQHVILNLLSSFVLWGFLAAIVAVVVSGYLRPWSSGHALDIYGLAIPSPINRLPWLHEVVESVHGVAGRAFIPLLALHILGALKHLYLDDDKSAARMFKLPGNGGV